MNLRVDWAPLGSLNGYPPFGSLVENREMSKIDSFSTSSQHPTYLVIKLDVWVLRQAYPISTYQDPACVRLAKENYASNPRVNVEGATGSGNSGSRGSLNATNIHHSCWRELG